MKLLGQNFIGPHPSAESADVFCAINPTTNEDLSPSFHSATPNEVQRAADLAGAASQAYAATEATRRADFLESIAAQIEANADEIAQRANQETAIPLERLAAERGRTCNQLRLFTNLIREGSWVEASIDTAIPDRAPIPKPDLRRISVPLGPVAVFGASNFPLAYSVAGGDTASALAAGCPVVVKAHPAHPGTSEITAQCILNAAEQHHMPEGVFSMVHGGAQTGMSLVQHPAITAVGFTGSQRAGLALFEAANSRPNPIPLFAEMGSINPIFLLPGALAERLPAIAAGYVKSLTLGIGQFCTNPGVVIGLRSAEFDEFLNECSRMLETIDPAVMLSTSICENYSDGVRRLRENPLTASVFESQVLSANEAAPHVFRTTAAAFIGEDSLRHEVFGPSSIAVECESLQEMIEIALTIEGQLTSTVHVGDADGNFANQLVQLISRKAGRVILNGYPTGVEVCPSMVHGGPFPSTTDSRFTSVGTYAIRRFVRPVCYQDVPEAMLPAELHNANPRGIWRNVNGQLTRDPI